MATDDSRERLELPEVDADAFTRRREALHRAVTELDGELDALEAGSPPDAERFRAALRALLTTLQQHIDEAEAADGLLGRIVEDAPWFGARVSKLRSEHDEYLRRVPALLEQADGQADVTPLLAEARDLSSQLSEHRHRGTALLQDAYLLDIPES